MLDFIQLGANQGDTETDYIYKVQQKNNWRGILVEPHPHSYKLLKENYKDREGLLFENVAIRNYDGVTQLHYQDASGLNEQASVIGNHHLTGKPSNEVMEVPCATLATLIRKYELEYKVFYLLEMDIEKGESEVILSTNFDVVCPYYIRFEDVHHTPDEQKRIKMHLAEYNYVPLEDPIIMGLEQVTERPDYMKAYKYNGSSQKQSRDKEIIGGS